MTSHLSCGDQFLIVSNHDFAALIGFAIEVGGSMAKGGDEVAYVAALRKFEEASWPGIDIDLPKQFPTIGERKWWAGVFDRVTREVFERRLGGPGPFRYCWQRHVIGEGYWISVMLSRLVQQEERGWHPPG